MDFINELGIGTLNPCACGGGQWLSAGRSFASINPARGEPIASAGACGGAEYEQVMAAAVAAFERWRALPAPRRGELVRRIGDELRRYKDALGSLISLETGKIKQEGDGEVQEMIDIADFAVGLSRMLYGSTMHSERPRHRLYEQWHPLGVVGIITAFNFPAAVWAWNAFIAAVAGDAVVWKPSPKAPLTAIAIQHIVNRVTRELEHPGVFSLLISDEEAAAQRFVADPRVALVSFTGSSAVGRQVARVVAQRMGRCLLECSGNNAVIVDETANLDLALRAIVFGTVGTAGQRCTSTRRLIVHESRYDELAARLTLAYRQVRIGDPLDPQTLMGPLIDADARDRFLAAVTQCKALGGRILYGGEKETGGGREAGSDAWKAYMRRQTNTINWGADLPLAQGIRFDVG